MRRVTITFEVPDGASLDEIEDLISDLREDTLCMDFFENDSKWTFTISAAIYGAKGEERNDD